MTGPTLLPGGFIARRDFLQRAGGGIGALGLLSLLQEDGYTAPPVSTDPLAPRIPHYPAKIKRVISVFCFGGLSHMDSFDPKPELTRMDGTAVSGNPKFDTGGRSAPGKLMKSPWEFRNYGQSGMPVSSLFPNIAKHVDEFALIRSMKSDSNNHVPAVYHMLTGSILAGRPGLGSWVSYGLGTENRSLPSFVVMTDPRALVGGGAGNWSNGFLPANHQGVLFRSQGLPVLNLTPPKGVSDAEQRASLKHLEALNAGFASQRPLEQELAARMRSYELAYRMQSEATAAVDISKETAETQALYGMDRPETMLVGRQCLLARRLVERGVRFVQLYSGGGVFDQSWDAHNGMVANHNKRALEIDQPVHGLLTDLKRRGLDKDTLVVFHTEFGRMPFTEGSTGRDHNPRAFSVWLWGGGIKGGSITGATDEIGYDAVSDVKTVFDLNATILHLLGLDHTRLTYKYAGRSMRLTDVSGDVIKSALA
jgi:hypothetical protein